MMNYSKSRKSSTAVIDLGFGDSGKGVVVNSLCSSLENALVIRYSGGQQAGHTVMLDGARHVFSNFGSGTLRGVPTYWSKYCSFDPVGAMNELYRLQAKGFTPKLYLSMDSPITTPYDKSYNQNTKTSHGTCGVGVGATFEREENRYSLTVRDLFFDSIFKIKYNLVKAYYRTKLSLPSPEDLTYFIECCEKVKSNNLIFIMSDSLPKSYDNYIFEGSQGLLLDQDIGFFPHVTRSSVGSKNILEICKSRQGDVPQYNKLLDQIIADQINPNLFLVTRAFQTRHGNGPMTNEHLRNNIQDNPYETNINNKFQGEFRKTLLDVDLLKYGMGKDAYIRTSKKKELVITCMDLIKNEYRYTKNGQIVNCLDASEFARSIADYLGIEKVHIIDSPYGKELL